MATDFIFADDSRQTRPSRKGVGKLVALGGIHVTAENVGPLEDELQRCCTEIGFPRDEQFKWSPGKKEKFQKGHLDPEGRVKFFERVVTLAHDYSTTATVVIEDEKYKTARKSSKNHEHDVTSLFLERADKCFEAAGRRGVVVIAKPGGGAKNEDKFLQSCIDLIEEGTEYVSLKNLALPVVTAPSRHVRILQLADIIVSCTVARIAGESNFSPQLFELIKQMYRREGSRIGGIGLKLHPDNVYANLYHWLLGEQVFRKGLMMRHKLPIKRLPYSTNSGEAADELRSAS